MAKTATERQKEYQGKRLAGEVKEQRFYAWLPENTHQRLADLAAAHRLSRRAMVIKLIEEHDAATP